MSQPDVPLLNRRSFLVAAGAALPVLAFPAAAISSSRNDTSAMRGAIDASEFGVRPGTLDPQSRAFQAMLDRAGERDMPIFLPPGVYPVSGLTLPRHIRLHGVAGATRLVLSGSDHLIAAADSEFVELRDINFEAAGQPLADGMRGLVDLRRVGQLRMDGCAISGSGAYGLYLEAVSGHVERNIVTTAAEAGIFSVSAEGLSITGNTVEDCANGGILVHRWEKGEDGTIVTGNRVSRIAATNGGTGQFGNGINTYRADGVMIANNIVSDCAFSAIRANGSGNIHITGNNCARSGETAVYAEFGFEGAIITSNIVDGAANGISVVNFNEGGRMAVCSGNIVRNLSEQGPYEADPPGFGVGITVEADTAVSSNVVENAPRYGFHIGWGPFMRNVVATGNVVRNAAEGIAVSVVEGTGSAVISDNVFDRVRRGGVIGHRWTEAVTGDLAAAGASNDFPNLVVERNRVR